eukprot:1196065-Prorocentrum_minimum.AAC.4
MKCDISVTPTNSCTPPGRAGRGASAHPTAAWLIRGYTMLVKAHERPLEAMVNGGPQGPWPRTSSVKCSRHPPRVCARSSWLPTWRRPPSPSTTSCTSSTPAATRRCATTPPEVRKSDHSRSLEMVTATLDHSRSLPLRTLPLEIVDTGCCGGGQATVQHDADDVTRDVTCDVMTQGVTS